jgi:hypothetical protein
MKATKLVRITILIVVLGGLAAVIYLLGPFSQSPVERQFYELVRQGRAKTENPSVDLRKIDLVQWDELVYWGPYEDICSLGISGYEKGSQFCRVSVDDSESYLLLLRGNRVVSEIRIDRSEIDLVQAQLKTRVSKANAMFAFVNTGNVVDPKQTNVFPAVQLTVIPE